MNKQLFSRALSILVLALSSAACVTQNEMMDDESSLDESADALEIAQEEAPLPGVEPVNPFPSEDMIHADMDGMFADNDENAEAEENMIGGAAIALEDPSKLGAPPANEAPTPMSCGGLLAKPCPLGYVCVDDPGDSCDPKKGGSDCGGICVSDGSGTSSPAPGTY